MIHPDTRLEVIDPLVGLGVVATKLIPAGTLSWVIDPLDRVLAAEDVARLPAMAARRFTDQAYMDEDGRWILCWDIARYMNHSCDCNCAVTPWGAEIACRDIAPGEELTNEYALFNLAPHEEFDCRCGSPACRGRVDSRETASIRRKMERRMRAALRYACRVAQPLWPLLSEESAARISGNADRGR